jgi:hypothetical protein
LNDICIATKANGDPCTLPATGQQGVCWAHDERYAARRRATASKGGRARANPLTRELHTQLATLAQDVASGDLPAYRGAVVVQILNCRIRLIETERRIQEQEELLERLDALERSRGGGGSRWAG